MDTVVGTGKQGPQIFTLTGAEHAYRVLIESMNEGALTLTANKTILHANRCFARMVQLPLEQVTGSSFRRFISFKDRATLRPLMKHVAKTGAKLQVQLIAADGSRLPVQISIQKIAKVGFERVTISMVVTDMAEARRNEELLRALTNRVLQVQEAERGRVALELHDHITQLLCAILFRCQTLVEELSALEAMKLREMLGKTSEEVERISRNLRPGVLDELGLEAVLRATSTEFTHRTGVPVKLACVKLAARLPANTELALYRILQEALKNVDQHARSRHVTVQLTKQTDFVQLTIKDDGTGFDTDRQRTGKKVRSCLGQLGMRERATYVGGTFTVKSVRRSGTHIEVRIPLKPGTFPV